MLEPELTRVAEAGALYTRWGVAAQNWLLDLKGREGPERAAQKGRGEKPRIVKVPTGSQKARREENDSFADNARRWNGIAALMDQFARIRRNEAARIEERPASQQSQRHVAKLLEDLSELLREVVSHDRTMDPDNEYGEPSARLHAWKLA